MAEFCDVFCESNVSGRGGAKDHFGVCEILRPGTEATCRRDNVPGGAQLVAEIGDVGRASAPVR